MSLSKKLFVFLFSFIANFAIVSAQYFGYGLGIERFLDSLVINLEPILRVLFGGRDYTGYLLFEKLLLFVLVAIFVYLALSNFPFFKSKNKYLARIVAMIISLIGIRNLNYVWVNTVITQYSVLFIAIAGLLPFILFWFFLKDFDSFIRKVGWVFFTLVYFGLWITSEVDAYESIYLWTGLAGLFYAFVLDSQVKRWLDIRDIKSGDRRKKTEFIAALRRDINELRVNLRSSGLSASEVRDIEDLIKYKEKQIARYSKY